VSGAEDFEDKYGGFFGIFTGIDTFFEMIGEVIADGVVI